MSINQDMIRAYLLRDIANKNSRLSGLMISRLTSSNDYKIGFNEILHFFAGGKNAITLDIINNRNNDINKEYAAYYFFDVDTLIAYNQYLQSIISEIDVATYESGHKRASAMDYNKGLKIAQKKLLEQAGTIETGFYNKTNPITLQYKYKDGKRQLDPQKPMSKEQFDKKYNIFFCRKEVEKYLEAKRAMKALKAPAKQGLGTIDYTYRGKKLTLDIVKKEYYTDIEGSGLHYVVAKNNVGTLMGTYNVDGSVYHGDLYDREGRLVEVDGGGEEFFENIRKSNYVESKSKDGKEVKGQFVIEDFNM